MKPDERRIEARRLVGALSLVRPLTAATLHRQMEGIRGRRIVVRPAPGRMVGSGVCGLWLSVDGEDVERIYYAPTESAVHRQQFINHEYGHLILGQGKELLPAERIALLAPLIPLDAIVHALARTSFTDEQEALAEAIGDELARALRRDRDDARHGPATGFGRVL